MKIIEIHIYGYGKLANYKLRNLQDFQVLYGENEAGKSTIMSFIHSILFGFPTKQQTELRYEPKNGTKYGGQLIVLFQDKGKVVIERVKGKAAGDVSVLLEDGTQGGEELLKNILKHVDKALFQAIFSFNIHGLQNIHQMKGEDIGRFLFSAGALGTDQLIRTENMLQKELDSRFKPSGKKPIINEKLRELKQLKAELMKAAQHNEKYWSLLAEKERLENQINEKQAEQALLQQRNIKLDAWRDIKPLKLEEQALLEELKEYEEIVFPVDGLSRLDRLDEMMKPLEGHVSSLSKKIDVLKQEISSHTPNGQLLEKEHEIIAAIENLSLLENLIQEEKDLQAKISQLKQNELMLREKLHLPIDEEGLHTINTSIFMKEEINSSQDKFRRLQVKKLDLDDRFYEEKQMLEEIEEKIKSLEGQLLSETEKTELEAQLSDFGEQKEIDKKITLIEEKLERLYETEKYEQRNISNKRVQEKRQFTLFSLIFAVLITWGIIEMSWPIILLGTIGILSSIFLFQRNSTKTGHDFIKQEIADLETQKRTLLEKMKNYDWNTFVIKEDKLQKHKEIQEQLKDLNIKWAERNAQYEKVLHDFEVWELEAAKYESMLIRLGKELFLPKEIALVHLSDAFDLLEQMKKLANERNIIVDRYDQIKVRIDEYVQLFKKFGLQYLGKTSSSIQEIAHRLRILLKEESEKQILHEGKKGKHEELNEELQRYQLELEHFRLEKDQLFQLAHSIDEERFREIGKLDRRKRELQEQLHLLERQLKLYSVITRDEMKEFETIIDLEGVILSHTVQLEGIKKHIPILQNALAEIKYEIQLLEDGGTYTELLHLYKQKTAELEIEAKEWAKFALAKDLLHQTIERFKNDRLPRLLKKAEEYLNYLTDGHYDRIYPKKEGSGFLIQRKDQIVFEANELSQATAEQVYVAFRLALAVTVYERFPFPIIIDDSFVNFDQNRTYKIISLLKGFKDRQILFFTCHNHLLTYFSEDQRLEIAKEDKMAIN